MSQLHNILFALRTPKSDDEQSDSNSVSSSESGDLAHIPLANLDINFEKLSLDEMQAQQATTSEQVLAQLVDQITSLNTTISQMSSKQQTHEAMLNNLVNPASTSSNYTSPVVQITGDIFRIPDPIKSIPTYDGNRKQLQAWITAAENTLKVFENLVNPQTYEIYVQAVLNKITGNAKDVVCLAGNPLNFEDVKTILLEAFGDRQELATYKAQLWSNKQNDDMNIHRYYRRTKEIMQNIKTIAKQNKDYNDNWAIICKFIDEDVLAAFISGLKHPYFGYAQAAKPDNIESAYAFLCKFVSAEKISTQLSSQNNYTKQSSSSAKQYNTRHISSDNRNHKPLANFSNPNIPKTGHSEQKNEMEIDPSLKSRLTLNRKILNNQEIESDEEVSDVEANFCTMFTPDTNK